MGEEDSQQKQHPPSPQEVMQELRSKATELLLREEWKESVQVYNQIINLCHDQASPQTELHKSLCLALSNRAEARYRLRDFAEALKDCDQALRIESAHSKSLVCKGKILLSLNRYAPALDCFKVALLDAQANGNLQTLTGYVEKCKKLEFQSRTGCFDLSDWVINGFRDKCPELAEYIGAVQIRRSELSGRGLFATKNIDTGTLLLVTKAIVIERGILASKDSDENGQLVMWKDFVDKVAESAAASKRIGYLISTLSTGEDECRLEVPEINLFRPEAAEGSSQLNEKVDMAGLLSVLDVNSLVERSVSAQVLGKNSDYYGVGLWLLSSFINHSCNPSARRLHVGDYLLVHACRDIKAGEEITFAYFDVLSPLDKRKEMSKTWGFDCGCRRCKFEVVCCNQHIEETEMGLKRGMDVGGVVFKLEEGMRRLMVRGKDKGYLRASFWDAYCEAYGSEKLMKRWGRRIPAAEAVVDSVAEAIGVDQRVVKVLIEGATRSGRSVMDMERVVKLGRGLYGKVVKKQALRSLLEAI